jgi:membrane protease YdiL (CAAX protease family)
MIDWRTAVTWFPGFGNSVRDVRRGLRFTWRLRAARLAASAARSATAEVPWTVLDVCAALLWMAALAAGAAIGFIGLRLLLSFGFAAAESSGHVRGGTFAALNAALYPYESLGMLLLFGTVLCCAVFYAVHRTTICKYRIGWSALSFRHAGWKTYGRVAALLVPLSLAGAVVTYGESRLLRAPLHNPQDALLMRGVAPLPLNFLLLFLLLVVVVPLAEETFFRGFLFRLLRRDLPLWAAASGCAVASSLVQGAPTLLPWFFLMGLAYALVVEYTRSLYSAIILHGLINALAALGIMAVLCNW